MIIPLKSLEIRVRGSYFAKYQSTYIFTARFIFDFYFLSALGCLMFIGRQRGVNVEDRERNIAQFLAVYLPKQNPISLEMTVWMDIYIRGNSVTAEKEFVSRPATASEPIVVAFKKLLAIVERNSTVYMAYGIFETEEDEDEVYFDAVTRPNQGVELEAQD